MVAFPIQWSWNVSCGHIISTEVVRGRGRRRRLMIRSSMIAMSLMTVGAFAGGALAVGPSRADMDFCNQKAAEVTKPSPVQPSTHNQPATAPRTGMPTGEIAKPGTPVSPGAPVQPAPPTAQPDKNPSGGRISDSTLPGIPPSQLGMAPIGESDSAYRQAYLACINERQK